jgi:hypothetical protein
MKPVRRLEWAQSGHKRALSAVTTLMPEQTSAEIPTEAGIEPSGRSKDTGGFPKPDFMTTFAWDMIVLVGPAAEL